MSPTEDIPVRIVLCVSEPVEPWLVTLRSIETTLPGISTTFVSTTPEQCSRLAALAGRDDEVHHTRFIHEAIGDVAARHTHALVVTAPVVFPPDPLVGALSIAEHEPRSSSVSFLSNAAGYLSFPIRHRAGSHQVLDKDEVTITRALRSAIPPLDPATIPYASGPVTFLTAQGISLIAPFPEHNEEDVSLAIAEYSCRSAARGMLNFLDATTYVTRPRDIVHLFEGNSWLLPHQEEWLEKRFPAALVAPFESDERSSAHEQLIDCARAAAFGLRVVVDGTMLQLRETGTQVTVTALVDALLKRDDISYVGLALSRPIPAYAKHLLESSSKLDVRIVNGGDFSEFPVVDIVHRPFQVDVDTDMQSWQKVGRRTVITVLDLIAFQNAVYHDSPTHYFAYRNAIRNSFANVDGIIAISNDVQHNISLERLSIDAERRFTVACGVDHVRGDEPAVMPVELLNRGFGAEKFLVVLGTNYEHKNRDLAIGILNELRSRGHDLSLVLAGAHVPFGSSRLAEAGVTKGGSPVWTIPDVSTEERNWLLRHASIVLYPTSAEGFGLVPDEAAAFGTPALFVQFGPLLERFPELPVAPKDWGVQSFADAAELLLCEPEVARRQVEAIAGEAGKYDWSTAADEIVDVYRRLLALPPRCSPSSGVRLDR